MMHSCIFYSQLYIPKLNFTSSCSRHIILITARPFRVCLPWELLYADDLVLIAETEDDLIKRLNKWKDNMANRGMRVNE